MAVYMVDRDLPRITAVILAALQGAEIATALQLSSVGRPVRYLRSLFIPGEARCLCLFEAPDAATVADLSWRGCPSRGSSLRSIMSVSAIQDE